MNQSLRRHHRLGVSGGAISRTRRDTMAFGRRQVDSTGTGRYPGNKRRASRVKSGGTAWLRLDGGFAMRACQLLDVSDTGVRIAVDPALRVPNDFVIVLSQGGQGRRCFVKWRNATQIGAQFV
jgi:hypothetical protein